MLYPFLKSSALSRAEGAEGAGGGGQGLPAGGRRLVLLRRLGGRDGVGHGDRVLWLRTSGPAALYAGGRRACKRGAVGGAAAGSGSGASSPLELSEDDDNEPLPK